MNTLIWGTCNTPLSQDQCVANMGWFLSTLHTACSQELSAQNAMVLQTEIGSFLFLFIKTLSYRTEYFPCLALQAYEVMRDAGCLFDPATNIYCFLNAVRNTDPTDLYFYDLPLGIGLPQNVNPLCSPCSGSVMSLYATALRNSTQPNSNSLTGLKKTYGPAAAVAIKNCGSTYATSTSSGVVALRPYSPSWAGVVIFIGFTLLLVSL
jgi:hypothetical protein